MIQSNIIIILKRGLVGTKGKRVKYKRVDRNKTKGETKTYGEKRRKFQPNVKRKKPKRILVR